MHDFVNTGLCFIPHFNQLFCDHTTFMITQWIQQIFVRKKHNIVWHLVSLQMTLCQRVCLQRHCHVCCHFFEKKYVVTRPLVDRNVLLNR